MRRAHSMMLACCSLPPTMVADVTRTSDGYYLGRMHGMIGFDLFLGTPNADSPHGWRAFRKLSLRDRKAVVLHARRKGIRLRDFMGKAS